MALTSYNYGNKSLEQDALEEIINRLGGTGTGTYGTNSGGFTTKVFSDITRPANATVYVAGQVWNADGNSEPKVAGVVRAVNKTGFITDAYLHDSANQTTKGEFDVYLFKGSPGPFADHAAIALTDLLLKKCIGVIRFYDEDCTVTNAGAGADGNCTFEGTIKNPIAVRLDDGESSLYYLIVVRNAYTPVSGETLTLVLGVSQDA